MTRDATTIVDDRAKVPVSFILPAHSGSRFLPQTLATVFAQTVGAYEVSAINHGSTHRTAVKLMIGATLHDQANFPTALLASRNASVALTTAAWISYIDADHLCAPEKLERHYAARIVNPSAKFTFTAFWQFNSTPRFRESVHEIHQRFAASAGLKSLHLSVAGTRTTCANSFRANA